MLDPAWLTFCREHLGLHELAGPESEPLISEAFKLCGLDPATHDDSTTPWCAAWLGLCLERSGIESTRKANARSYLDWGDPLLRPRVGCIVIFSRPPNPANGHVGLLAEMPSATAANLQVLGGNEGNRVAIEPYPVTRLLGWRWPSGCVQP